MGYEPLWLEGRLALAEIELQSGDSSLGRLQIGEITKQAKEKGLMLLNKKARAVAGRYETN